MTELLYQAELSQGATRTRGYIPERAAKVGAMIEIKEEGFEGLLNLTIKLGYFGYSLIVTAGEIVAQFDLRTDNRFGQRLTSGHFSSFPNDIQSAPSYAQFER